MNRRSFFSLLTHGSSFRTEVSSAHDRTQITAGLEPYATPLTRADALHLLRRLSFGPTTQMVTSLIGKSATAAVDMLLGDGTEPAPASPGTWVDKAQEDPNNLDIISKNGIEAGWRANFLQLQNWWANLMMNESTVLSEKLTMFWSGHFTTEFTYDLGYVPPQVLYRQNLMLRRDRLGNFKTFLEDVSLDPAMLVYLGGVLNVKGKPNENYGREMMELYSCGIGQYSEGDVKNAARVLTGWKAALYSDSPAKNGIFNAYFEPRDHDIEAKQFLENSIPARDDASNTEYQVRTEEVRKMIDILFRQRTDAVGRFMMDKLYRYFVYSNPSGTDASVIDELKTRFIESGFEIRPVVRALLSSAHFFDAANRGVQIKTPGEYVIGMARQLGTALPSTAVATSDVTKGSMASMEQVLMDPPNVAGWPGYRNWINTKSYPQRSQYARDLIKAWTDAQIQTFVKQFPNHTDVNALIDGVTEFLLPVPVSQKRREYYVSVALAGAKDYEWAGIINNPVTGGVRMRSLLNAMMKAPDFHLC
ncbi:MAG: DUF1800 family protein [Candidatus Kapaibacterium sp.]